MKTRAGLSGLFGAALLFGTFAFGGFASTEQFLAAVGNPEGAGGAHFFTTVWITDVSPSPVTFTFEFLRTGQANNGSNTQFSETLQPGQTKVYDDVAGTSLGLIDANGAARITANGELFVSERIFNQPPGIALSATAGQFFSGIPKSFSIGLGQSASLQGVAVGSGKDFRYNYVLLETSGAPCTVHVQLLDVSGNPLGASDIPLLAYEHLLLPAGGLAPSASIENARLVATVTSGSGTAIVAGSQVGNSPPQDQSGFEMSFPDEILAGGSGGVTSLNGLTGALTIAHGANTTVSVSGSTITIDAEAGSGTGLTAVAHDNSLAGSGTVALPLGIAAGQTVRSLNGLHDAVTLAAGSNVTLTPSGNTLTIAATGGGTGGLSLPYSGTVTTATGFQVINSGSGEAINGSGTAGAIGVNGFSASGYGIRGSSSSSVGVIGLSAAGNTNTAVGVYGTNSNANGGGVGGLNSANGNAGFLGGPYYGVAGTNAHGGQAGVYGTSASSTGYGVQGNNSSSGNNGYLGGVDYGVFGASSANPGVVGQTSSGGTGGVHGHNNSSGNDGYLGGPDYGAYGASSAKAGVYGTSGSGDAVSAHCQTSQCVGVQTYSVGTGFALITHGQGAVNGNFTIENDLEVVGNKSFVAPHPSDPTKEIRFVCLEGPESGTYFRGTGTIVGGFAEIPVPESFRLSTSAEGLTVVATPVGSLAVLAAVRVGLDRIVVQGSSDVAFSYIVNGVRKGFEHFQPIAENTHFIPGISLDPVFAKEINAEARRRLEANGILNPDGTINLETAHRLGWDRRPGWNTEEPR
ncbi:MAG: hypothetical protein ACRD16_16110 [Thermoanaerobaculia bacterium]